MEWLIVGPSYWQLCHLSSEISKYSNWNAECAETKAGHPVGSTWASESKGLIQVPALSLTRWASLELTWPLLTSLVYKIGAIVIHPSQSTAVPEFLAAGTSFGKTFFFHGTGMGGGERVILIQARYIYYALYVCSVAKSCPTLCHSCTVARHAPQCIGFSRQECCSGLPFPSPRCILYFSSNVTTDWTGGISPWPGGWEPLL